MTPGDARRQTMARLADNLQSHNLVCTALEIKNEKFKGFG
jgi:hypothetical protein